MDSFATVADYTGRYGTVGSPEMLGECLKGCTAVMQDELDRAGIDYSDPDEGMAFRLMDVCRSMARRILPEAMSAPVGVTQASIGAGGFTQSYSFSSFYGIARMVESEKRLLGIPSTRLGLYSMGG